MNITNITDVIPTLHEKQLSKIKIEEHKTYFLFEDIYNLNGENRFYGMLKYLSVYIYIVKRRTSTEVIVVLVHRLIANAHIHKVTLKS